MALKVIFVLKVASFEVHQYDRLGSLMSLFFLEVLLFQSHLLFSQELLVHLLHLLAWLQRLQLHHL